MMKLGADALKDYDLSALRFAASVGEPLNAEAVVWGAEAFGLPFHDNWWQTETGAACALSDKSIFPTTPLSTKLLLSPEYPNNAGLHERPKGVSVPPCQRRDGP